MRLSRSISSGLIALAFLLCLFSSAVTSWAANKTTTVKVGFFLFDGFHNIDEDGKYSGYGYDYLHELALYTDWEYEYVVAPWDECLRMLEKGEIDLLGSVQKTPARERVFDFAALQSGISSVALFTSLDNTTLAYEDFAAFDGMTAGLLRGNSRNDKLADYCREHQFSINTAYFGTQDELTDALESGAVDMVLTSDLRNTGNERIVAKFSPSPFYFAVTKGNDALLEALDYAQNRIKTANPYFDEELYRKYYDTSKNSPVVFSKDELAFMAESGTIRVAVKKDWLPFSAYDERRRTFSGIIPDYLAQISELTGLSFRLVPVGSYEDSIEALRTGEADLLGFFSHDYYDASRQHFFITKTYLSLPVVLVRGAGVADANHLRVVLPENNVPIDLSDELIKATDVAYLPSFEACLLAILNGEADCTYMNSYLANLLLSDSRFYGLSSTVLDGRSVDMCFAASGDCDRRLIQTLNTVIRSTSSAEMNRLALANTATPSHLTMHELLSRISPELVIVFFCIMLLIIAALALVVVIKIHGNKVIRRILDTDELTGLISSNKFMQDAQKRLRTADPRDWFLAYMDIDRFKFINETYGYEEGDRLLVKIAEVLKTFVGPGELVSRIFADNFVLLLQCGSRENALERLQALDAALETRKAARVSHRFQQRRLFPDAGGREPESRG